MALRTFRWFRRSKEHQYSVPTFKEEVFNNKKIGNQMNNSPKININI